MKNLVIKIATWALLAGLALTGLGLWDIYKERGVGTEAIQMSLDSVDGSAESLVYAQVSGGQLDITNTYEYGLSTKKAGAKVTSDFYTPVLNGNSVAYILKTPVAPTLQEMSKVANYSGLLQNKSELPEKILTAYDASFPEGVYSYLDSTYKPQTMLEKLMDLKIYVLLLLGGLAVRFIFSRNKKSTPEYPSEKTANT